MTSIPRDSSPSTSTARRLFFNRRFSNVSAVSLASINTILPQYSSESELPPDFEVPSSPLPFIVAEDHLSAPSSPPNSPIVGSPASDQSTSIPGPPIDGASRYSYINPRYSTILSSSSVGNAPRSAQSDELDYTFPIRSNKPWATLHLFNRDAVPGNLNPSQHQPKTPRFWGNNLINGVLQLDLDSPQAIQQITITIKGKIVTSSLDGGSCPFVSHQFMLWNRASGDPRQSSPDANPTSPNGKFDGKLDGKYTFPFALPFPTHVDLSTKTAVMANGALLSSFPLNGTSSTTTTTLATPPATPDKGKKKHTRPWSFSLPSPSRMSSDSSDTSKKNKRRSVAPRQMSGSSAAEEQTKVVCPMPQSFMEARINGNVQYEIVVHVVHGWLKPDSKIKTNISYLPAIVPLPASLRRQLAYEEGGVLPGPISDPNGWYTLPTAVIQGEFSESPGRQIDVTCTLNLAKPLSYTRGTVIPCYLTLTSDDAEALEILSSPKAPTVRLTRRLRHYNPQGGDVGLTSEEDRGNLIGNGSGTGGTFIATQIFVPTTGDLSRGSDLKTVIHEITTAVFWVPPKDVLQEPHIRHLEGEIHLASDLQPSCACTIFSIEYFVEILPFTAILFEPDSPKGPKKGCSGSQVVASHPVEITTLHRQGAPIPIAFSEPPKSRIRSLTVDTIYEQPGE